MPRKTTLGPTPTPAAPRVSSGLTQDVAEFLMSRYPMKRPPEVAAGVLAMICELYAKDAPFPSREEAAEALGASKWGIDTALGSAMARQLVELEVRVFEGHCANRDGVTKARFFKPSPELLAVAQASRAWQQRLRAA